MMISTRGRYALRVLIDLAEQASAGYLPISRISQRQGISKKYMEQIMPILVKGKLVEGLHGAKGGYRLKRKPEEYTVGEILRLTDGDFSPVACLASSATPCERRAECRTIAMWSEFNRLAEQYFDGIRLCDLMKAE